MISLDEYRKLCAERPAEDIVEAILLADDAVHVSTSNRKYVLTTLARCFGMQEACVHVHVVGSAKLDFSIVEKKNRKTGEVLPRYRPFGPDSDIDLAIVSSELFHVIWEDLSIYAHGQPWMPWNSGRLGDYMLYGWLRPDLFPQGGRVRKCDDWWDQFRRFSSDLRFGRRHVRGALFESTSQLRRYLRRAVVECIHAEQELK
jgi:hypothetical protein